MTDEQVHIAIAVLKAYTTGDLHLENDILSDLEQAIGDAFNEALIDTYDEVPDDDPGFDPRFLT